MLRLSQIFLPLPPSGSQALLEPQTSSALQSELVSHDRVGASSSPPAFSPVSQEPPLQASPGPHSLSFSHDAPHPLATTAACLPVGHPGSPGGQSATLAHWAAGDRPGRRGGSPLNWFLIATLLGTEREPLDETTSPAGPKA